MEIVERSKLGQLFEEVRERLDVTPYRMSIKLGISHSHYGHVSQTPTAVSVRLLCKLHELSGMTWAQFGKRLEGIAQDEE